MRVFPSILRGRGAPVVLVALGVIVLARTHAAPPRPIAPPPLGTPLDIDADADSKTDTPLRAVAWLSDRQLVGAGGGGLVGVFDLNVAPTAKTSTATTITPAGMLHQAGSPAAVFSLAALADGAFAWGDDAGAVRFGKPPLPATISPGATGPGLLVGYEGPDKAAVAYGSAVVLLDLAKDAAPKLKATLPTATGLGPITALAGAKGLVAAGDATGKVAVWKTSTSELLGMVEAPQPVAALAFDADDPPVLVSGHPSGQVILWAPPGAPPDSWNPTPIGDVAALAAETAALLATNETGTSKLVRFRRDGGGATSSANVGDGGAMVPTTAVAVRERDGDSGRVAAVFNSAPAQLRVFELDGSGEVTTAALIPAVYPVNAARLAISGTQVYAVLADGSVHRRDIAATGALPDAVLLASKGSSLGAPKGSGPVLVGLTDGTVAAFKADSAGTPIAISAKGSAAIEAVCPLPGGDPSKLALASGGVVSVWDGDHEVQRFQGLAAPVRDMIAFKDNDRVILAVLDKDLQVHYRVVTARSAGVPKPGAGVTALAVVGKESDRVIVAGLNDGGVCRVPASGGPILLDAFSVPPAPVAAVQAGDARITAVAGRFLGVWKQDSSTMEFKSTIYELGSSPGELASLAVGRDGVVAAGLSSGGAILMRPGDELDDPPRLAVARAVGESVGGVLFDGRDTLVGTSATGEATAWPDVSTSAAILKDRPGRVSRLGRLDAARLAAASLSGDVFAIDRADMDNPKPLHPRPAPAPGAPAPSPVWSLAVGTAGGVKFLAFSGDDRQLHLITDQGKTLFEDGATVHDGRIGTLALTRDGLRLASGSSDQRVKLWDITPAGADWKTAAAAKQPANGVFDGLPGAVVAALSYEPKLVAPRLAAAAASRLLVFDSDGTILFQSDAPSDVADLAWSPDGSALAVATAGGHLLVYPVP